MSEHLSGHDIERYQQRALTPTELLAVDRHLATCDQCHRRITQGREYARSVRDALLDDVIMDERADDDHLSYEQLAALVDGDIDDVDREIAAVHLEVCQPCAQELAGLQQLRADLAPALTGRQLMTEPRSRAPFFAWRPKPSLWAWPQLAGAALVVLVAGMSAWNMWQSIRHPKAEVVASQNQPGPSPRIVALLKDGGGEVTLDENGRVAGVGAVSSGPVSDAVAAALKTGRLNISPALAGLRGNAGVLMGASGEGVPFALITPFGSVVQTNRPTFRWQPLAGASSYVVTIYDTHSAVVARSAAQAANEWTVTSPLDRGVIYLWQVTADKNGDQIKSPVPPGAEARFKVLGTDENIAVERAAKTYAHFHLVRGTVFAEAGLLNEAEREFRLVLAANPDSPIAKDLLRDVVAALARQ